MISEPASSLRKRGVQDRRLSIIDVSSADDSLLDGDTLHHHSGYFSFSHSSLNDTDSSELFALFIHRDSRSNETRSNLPFQKTKRTRICCTLRTRRTSKTPPPKSSSGSKSLAPTAHPESKNIRKIANAICARVWPGIVPFSPAPVFLFLTFVVLLDVW